MTVATGLPSADQNGSVRPVSQPEPSGSLPVPRPAARNLVTTPGQPNQQASPAAGAAGRTGFTQSSQAGEPAPCGLCRLRAERAIAAPPGGCTCQVSATMAGRGPECAALAIVDAMDGGERAVLLRHLAMTNPGAVHAGVAWVAAWHADLAVLRRKKEKLRRKDQRRRQRQAEAAARPGAGSAP